MESFSKHQKLLLICCAVSGITACSNQELGSEIDEGGFGNPTMQNTLVMNGEIRVLRDVSGEFSAEIPDVVYFASGSVHLDAEARQILRQQAAFIRSFPELTFSTFGHADASGSPEQNEAIALRRANVVADYIVSQGVRRSQVGTVQSLGSSQPVDEFQGGSNNSRRVVTTISGLVPVPPLYLDGERAQIIYDTYVPPPEGDDEE